MPDLGWLGALAAGLAAVDPSGETARSFSEGFIDAHKKNQDDGDDDGTDNTPKKVKKTQVKQAAGALPGAIPQAPAMAPQPPASMPSFLQPATTSPSTPAPAPTQVAPPQPLATPLAPAQAPSVPSPTPVPAPTPAAPAKPVALPIPNPQTTRPPVGDVASALTLKGFDVPRGLQDIAEDEDVWGNGKSDETIMGLVDALKTAKSANDPAVATALKTALPSLRKYAANPEGDPDNQRYIRLLLSAYTNALGGK